MNCKCANCGCKITGTICASSVYLANFDLCDPCAEQEEKLIEEKGTNDLPILRAHYDVIHRSNSIAQEMDEQDLIYDQMVMEDYIKDSMPIEQARTEYDATAKHFGIDIMALRHYYPNGRP